MYSKIDSLFWNDKKNKTLTNDERYMFLYILTCPHKNVLGLFVLPLAYIEADLQWNTKEDRVSDRVSHTLSSLCNKGYILYEKETAVILIKNYLKYNPLESSKQMIGAKKVLLEIPVTRLENTLISILASFKNKEKSDEYNNGIDTLCHTLSDRVSDILCHTHPDTSNSNSNSNRRIKTTPKVSTMYKCNGNLKKLLLDKGLLSKKRKTLKEIYAQSEIIVYQNEIKKYNCIEKAIKDIYVSGYEDIDRLLLKHIQSALERYKNSKGVVQINSPQKYFEGCLKNAIQEEGLEEIEPQKVEYETTRRRPGYANYEQRKYDNLDFLYSNFKPTDKETSKS